MVSAVGGARNGPSGAGMRDWGRRLVFVAGLAPAAAGLVILAMTLWSSTAGYQAPWLSLMGRHGFSGERIAANGPEFWSLWLLNSHLAGANLTMSGATIAVLAWFGLREESTVWAVPFLAVLLLWVGGNDVAALVHFRLATGMGFPVALIPLVLGLSGLAMFRRGRENHRKPFPHPVRQ